MSTARDRWRTHLRNRIGDVLESIPQATRPDVYVVQLTAYAEHGDGRRLAAALAWNTKSHLERRRANLTGYASFVSEFSPYEFAGRDAAVIGAEERDPEGVVVRREWIEELGLWYEDAHADLAVTEQDPEIWTAFRALIIDIAHELHEEGRLHVPLLIDAEYLDDAERRALNREANPAHYHALLDRWSSHYDEDC